MPSRLLPIPCFGTIVTEFPVWGWLNPTELNGEARQRAEFEAEGEQDFITQKRIRTTLPKGNHG